MAENTGNGGVILSLATASGEFNSVQFNELGQLQGTNQFFNATTGNSTFGNYNSADQSKSALVSFNTDNKAVMLPRIDNLGDITEPKPGMIVYDTTSEKIRFFDGGKWAGPETGIEAAVTDVQTQFRDEKHGLEPIVVENAAVESYVNDTNVSYVLAAPYTAGATTISLTLTSKNRDLARWTPKLPLRLNIVQFFSPKKYVVLKNRVSPTGNTYEIDPLPVGLATGTVIETQMTERGLPVEDNSPIRSGTQVLDTEDLISTFFNQQVNNQQFSAFRKSFSQKYEIIAQDTDRTRITIRPVNSMGIYRSVPESFPQGTSVCIVRDNWTKTAWNNNFRIYKTSAPSRGVGGNDIELRLNEEVPQEFVGSTDFFVYKLPKTRFWAENALASLSAPREIIPSKIVRTDEYALPDEIKHAWLMQENEFADYIEKHINLQTNLSWVGTNSSTTQEIKGQLFRGGFTENGSGHYEFNRFASYNPLHIGKAASRYTYTVAACFTLAQGTAGEDQILFSLSTLNDEPTGNQLAIKYDGGNGFLFSIGDYEEKYILTNPDTQPGRKHTLLCFVDSGETPNEKIRVVYDGIRLTNIGANPNATITRTNTFPTEWEATQYPMSIGNRWRGYIGGVAITHQQKISGLKEKFYSFLLNTYGWNIPILNLFYRERNITADRLTMGIATQVNAPVYEFNFDIGSGFIVR